MLGVVTRCIYQFVVRIPGAMPVPRGNSIALNGGRKEKGYMVFLLWHKLAIAETSARFSGPLRGTQVLSRSSI